MSDEWRRVSETEWWLLGSDAPDPVKGEDGRIRAGQNATGCVYPPSMVASWFPEGCLHLYSYSNGAEPADDRDEDVDYFHVCDLQDFIDELTQLRDSMPWKRAAWDQEDRDRRAAG